MPIIVTCTGCGRKLRLAEQHAGKTARCPMCRMTFPVPADAAITPAGSGDDVLQIGPDDSTPTSIPTSAGSKSPSSSPAYSFPAEAWFLRVPEGHQYGPVSKGEMDSWVKEGRVTSQCHLKNGESAPWQPAGAIYSFLGAAPAAPQQQPVQQPMQPANPYMQPAQPANPYAQPMPGAPFNPYASPMAPQMSFPPGGYGWRKPHRGGMILALGIVGFLFCCPILHVVNLAMSFSDLSEMDRGQMDSSGQGLTRTGQVLSVIALIGWCLCLFIGLLGGIMDIR